MYNAPHWPWQGPLDRAYPDSTDFRSGGSAPIFAEMMKSLDNSIGEVMNTLDEEQLSNETIVIFTNDNGGERYSDQAGFSNRKGALWEGGIRVPAFVRWPGKIKAGLVTEQVVITMDWTTTILAFGKSQSAPGHNTSRRNRPVTIVDWQNCHHRTYLLLANFPTFKTKSNPVRRVEISARQFRRIFV